MRWMRAGWSRQARVAVGVATAAFGLQQSQARERGDCTEHGVAVGSDAARRRLQGTLCQPRLCATSTIQVLVHGATFDRRYWHATVDRGHRSYVEDQLRGGYATFSYDRLGAGQSDHPPSAEVTIDEHVQNLHEIVLALRSGTIGGTAYERVVLVGHSLGSIVAVLEAGTHDAADALIVSGFSHFGAPSAAAAFASSLQPAAAEPQFAGLDAGYLTTLPGARARLFFSAPVAAGLLDLDESTKGTVAVGEFAPSTLGDVSALVRVPVLVAAGARDAFSCSEEACTSSSELAARETAMFSASPSVRAIVLPNSGHALNLQRGSARWAQAARAWLDHVVGTLR